MPGVTDVNEAIKMIGETPILEFKEQNDEPSRELTLEEREGMDDFNKEVNIYFAPNCKEDIFYCLVHPRKSLWYGKTIIEDKIREFRQQESDKKKFQDGVFVKKFKTNFK